MSPLYAMPYGPSTLPLLIIKGSYTDTPLSPRQPKSPYGNAWFGSLGFWSHCRTANAAGINTEEILCISVACQS
jgi:hypothetical protein